MTELSEPFGYIRLAVGGESADTILFRVEWVDYHTVSSEPTSDEMRDMLFNGDGDTLYFYGERWDSAKTDWVGPFWVNIPAHAYFIASWDFKEGDVFGPTENS